MPETTLQTATANPLKNRPSFATRRLGDLVLDTDWQTVAHKSSGETQKLRRREFQVLSFLFNNPRSVINRYSMLDLIWDYNSFVGSNTLEVHLCSLRRKLKELGSGVRIETIRGIGYRLITGSGAVN